MKIMINKTTNLLSPITRKDGKIIIPAKIFAQDGILRNVYKLNSWWNNRENYNKEFFEKILGNTLNKEEVEAASMATTKEELNVILIRKEQQCESGGYVNSLNPNLSNQGIGSGAGYIEISNGTFILK